MKKLPRICLNVMVKIQSLKLPNDRMTNGKYSIKSKVALSCLQIFVWFSEKFMLM